MKKEVAVHCTGEEIKTVQQSYQELKKALLGRVVYATAVFILI